MAKKLGKFLALSAVIGAAAGAYYYYKSKDNDLDDFDDFDDDLNEDLEDFLKNETDGEDSKREYVPLNFSKETVAEAKETIKKAAETVEDAVAHTVESVGNVVKPVVSETVEEFKFDDLDEVKKEEN